MSKKSHHFLMLWPWPLTYDLEKLIRSGHYHYQCVYQIWEQSIQWFLSYRVNTIAGGGRRVAGGGRLRRKTITSPDPSDTGDINIWYLLNVRWEDLSSQMMNIWYLLNVRWEDLSSSMMNIWYLLNVWCWGIYPAKWWIYDTINGGCLNDTLAIQLSLKMLYEY